MKRIRLDSWALDRSRAHIRQESHLSDRGAKLAWLEGTVVTVHGIVTVYSQGNNGARPYSAYSVVASGRLYHGSEERTRTKRGLAQMASKFARLASEMPRP